MAGRFKLRDDERQTVKVKIGKLSTDRAGSKGDFSDLPKLGLNLQSLTPELAERFGYEDEKGVLVADVESGSVAERAGIRRGSLILEIDRQQVTSPKEAKELLKRKKKTHLLLVRQREGTRYIAIKTE